MTIVRFQNNIFFEFYFKLNTWHRKRGKPEMCKFITEDFQSKTNFFIQFSFMLLVFIIFYIEILIHYTLNYTH